MFYYLLVTSSDQIETNEKGCSGKQNILKSNGVNFIASWLSYVFVVNYKK